LALRPLEGHTFSAVRDCSFSIFAATPHSEGRFSIRKLRSRHTVVTGNYLSLYVHIIYNQIKFMCLTYLCNRQNVCRFNASTIQSFFQPHFKHHLLNSMFCSNCQPLVHIYYRLYAEGIIRVKHITH